MPHFVDTWTFHPSYSVYELRITFPYSRRDILDRSVQYSYLPSHQVGQNLIVEFYLLWNVISVYLSSWTVSLLLK